LSRFLRLSENTGGPAETALSGEFDEPDAKVRVHSAMSKAKKLEWPWWSTWAAVFIVLTCVATIAATLNDIW